MLYRHRSGRTTRDTWDNDVDVIDDISVPPKMPKPSTHVALLNLNEGTEKASTTLNYNTWTFAKFSKQQTPEVPENFN